MKKPILLFLITATLILAEDFSIPEKTLTIEGTPSFQKEEGQQKYFSYLSVGGCGFVLPLGPEVSIGLRKLGSRNGWDFQGGTSLMAQYFWAQGSYLHYFIPTRKSYSSPYMGVGLTVGYSRVHVDYVFTDAPYANIPFTMGYQWGKDRKNQFFQIQFTPLVITTFSYGFGF